MDIIRSELLKILGKLEVLSLREEGYLDEPQESYPNSPEEFSSAPETWEKVAKLIGIDPHHTVDLLGRGANGSAYYIGPVSKWKGDVVLKVSKDEKEAQAMKNVLKGNGNLDFLVKVHKVWKFPKLKKFGVLMEALEEADPEWKIYSSNIQDGMFDTELGFPLRDKGDLDRLIKQISKIYKMHMRANLKPDMIKWLIGLNNEFLRLGISYFDDFNIGNILKRVSDGKHVLIDLGGGSKSNRVRLPLVASKL